MPKPLDPATKEFVDTTQLPAGKYQSRMLCDIGSTIDGLKYLQNLVTSKYPPPFLQQQLRRAIRKYIDRPDRQLALKQNDGRR